MFLLRVFTSACWGARSVAVSIIVDPPTGARKTYDMNILPSIPFKVRCCPR